MKLLLTLLVAVGVLYYLLYHALHLVALLRRLLGKEDPPPGSIRWDD